LPGDVKKILFGARLWIAFPHPIANEGVKETEGADLHGFARITAKESSALICVHLWLESVLPQLRSGRRHAQRRTNRGVGLVLENGKKTVENEARSRENGRKMTQFPRVTHGISR
jgi:hypothetical protein